MSTLGPSFTFRLWTLRISKPAFHVRKRDVYLPIESARPRQGGIEHVDAVGGGADDHLIVGVEAVHFNEDGIEGLLAFIVSAAGEPAAAATADGVDFIQEDDAGAVVLGLFEEVSHSAGADADEHFDEIGTADAEEWAVGFAGDGLGEKGFSGAGLADQQHAARDSTAEALEFLGVLQELDNFHHLFLGLFDSGHIVESDVGVILGGDFVFALAEAAEHSTGAGAVAELAEDEEPDEAEDQQPGHQRQQDVHEEAGLILGFDLGGAALVHQVDKIGSVGKSPFGVFGAEKFDVSGGARNLDAVFDFAFDVVAVDGEFFDSVLGQERLKIGDWNRLVGVGGAAEKHDQHDGQADEEHPSEQSPTDADTAAVWIVSAIFSKGSFRRLWF